MDAFALYTDLATLLKRTFTSDEQAWVTSLLEKASTYLRDDVLGLQVYPQSSSTFTAYPDGGRIDIPNPPLISIDAVQRDGVDVTYSQRDSTIWVDYDEPVDITFTYGYTTAPESLKQWACVLVSQTMMVVEQELGLSVGGLSSVALDDFKVAFADAGELTGTTLSDRNIALLREQFGVKAGYVVTTR